MNTRWVAGVDAVRILDELRKQYPSTGSYPFMIGDEKDLELLEETAEFESQVAAEIVGSSLEIDVDAWLVERRKEAEWYEFDEVGTIGEWPRELPDRGSLTIHTDIRTGKCKPKVLLGLARVDASWHLPATLKWGSWNSCPQPQLHCAFHRHWQEQLGAEITGMSHDVIECVVAHPPTNQTAAMNLAREQYWYCPDIVEQGCGSISKLGATLMNSRYWYFWWD